jgi:hypothetical protein
LLLQLCCTGCRTRLGCVRCCQQLALLHTFLLLLLAQCFEGCSPLGSLLSCLPVVCIVLCLCCCQVLLQLLHPALCCRQLRDQISYMRRCCLAAGRRGCACAELRLHSGDLLLKLRSTRSGGRCLRLQLCNACICDRQLLCQLQSFDPRSFCRRLGRCPAAFRCLQLLLQPPPLHAVRLPRGSSSSAGVRQLLLQRLHAALGCLPCCCQLVMQLCMLLLSSRHGSIRI